MDSGAVQVPPAIGPKTSGWLDLLVPPWRRFVMISRLPPAQVVAAMREATEPRRRHRFAAPGEEGFEGTVAADKFLVNRIVGYREYRNAFVPFITGRIQPARGGSRIVITMRPHLLVLAFMAPWMVIPIGLLLVPGWFSPARQQLHSLRLLGAGFLVLSYLFCSIPFGLEVRWAIGMLQKILLPRRWNQWGRNPPD